MGLEPGTLVGATEEEQEARGRDMGEGSGVELEKRRQRRVRAYREARGVKEQLQTGRTDDLVGISICRTTATVLAVAHVNC